MMPWGVLDKPGSQCFTVALAFFALALLNMHDWQIDEVSYSLQLRIFTLEGTFRDIEPKELAIDDVVVSPWILAFVFIALTLVMGMWCARRRALL